MLAPLPSGRHHLSREQVVRSQRIRLLNAAIAVAGTDGYAAMTVSAVIGRANVSRKTFYEQFADREHCFLAAYAAIAERALAGARRAYEVEAPWPERLHAALAWTLAALADRPAEARVAFVEVLAAGPQALDARDRTVREAAALLAPGFGAAPAGTAIPPSTPTAILGGLSALIAHEIRHGAVARLPELLPDLLFCALAPFVGPGAAAELVASAPAPRPPAHA
jgi:AcrR family transcriptional regulator